MICRCNSSEHEHFVHFVRGNRKRNQIVLQIQFTSATTATFNVPPDNSCMCECKVDIDPSISIHLNNNLFYMLFNLNVCWNLVCYSRTEDQKPYVPLDISIWLVNSLRLSTPSFITCPFYAYVCMDIHQYSP